MLWLAPLVVVGLLVPSTGGVGSPGLPSGGPSSPNDGLGPGHGLHALGQSSRLPPSPTSGTNGPWSKQPASGPTPAARDSVALTYDAADSYVVLFGGINISSSAYYNDTWTYAGGTWTQLSTPHAPSPRRGATMTFDVGDGYVVLFGGIAPGGQFLNDTWMFLAGNWTDLTGTTTKTPAARAGGGLVYDANDSYVLMFGGCTSLGCYSRLNDTWTFKAGTWKELRIPHAPAPRGTDGSMIWYPPDHAALLFGGSSDPAHHANDTWEYSGGTWTQLLPSSSPENRSDDWFVFDPDTGYAVLFGGEVDVGGVNGPAGNDTWVFQGGSWYNQTMNDSAGPPAIQFLGGGTWDATDGYGLLVGGRNLASQDSNRTWTFSPNHWPPVNLTFAPTDSHIDEGRNATFVATAVGGTYTFTYAYSGFPSACPSRNTSRLVCAFPAAGSYDLGVSVVDTIGTSANASIRVVVSPALGASGAASPATIDLGQSMNYSVTTTGGSGGFSYQYATLPPGCAPADTPRLRCVPNAAGNYTSSVMVGDAAGSSVSIPDLNVTVDPRPTVSIVAPTALDSGQSLNLTAHAALGTPPYTYSWHGLPSPCGAVDLPTIFCTPTANGGQNVYANISVDVLDGAGLRIQSGTTRLVIAPDPILNATAQQPGTVEGIAIVLDTAVSFGTAPYSYSWSVDGSAFAAGNSSLSPVFASAGNHRVGVQMTDSVGWTAEANVSVTVVPPLGASVLESPSAPITLGQSVDLNARPSGGLGPYDFAWSGLPRGCPLADQSEIRCTPADSGSFSVSVTVQDTLGEHQSRSVTILVNPTLRARATAGPAPSPCSGAITVNFSAAVSGGTRPYQIDWDFGDGTAPSNASPVAHRFPGTGSYVVELTVSDAAGATASSWVNQTLPPGSCPSGGTGLGGIPSLDWAVLVIGAGALIVASTYLVRRRARASDEPAPDDGSNDPDAMGYGDDPPTS